ncbi:unnamed protein product [Paramecium sonneborni]|uniref:Uncharacterized protein n=1 Tax=Paramecium sonneborni TaxID=65129 RepID=A0A8S1RFV9_9CILI|nr:unnamed protein product [Paramecium sonneborni]
MINLFYNKLSQKLVQLIIIQLKLKFSILVMDYISKNSSPRQLIIQQKLKLLRVKQNQSLLQIQQSNNEEILELVQTVYGAVCHEINLID